MAVAQGLWGVELMYNLIRLEMVRAAAAAGVPPTWISFVAALRRHPAPSLRADARAGALRAAAAPHRPGLSPGSESEDEQLPSQTHAGHP